MAEWKNRPAINAAMLAVYDATNITENPPHTLIRNLFGHDLGALKATKWPHSNPQQTHSAEDMLRKQSVGFNWETKFINE